MNIKNYNTIDERYKNVPYLKATDMGEARQILFVQNGREAKNIAQDKKNEIFFSIEKRQFYDKLSFNYVHTMYGYMKRNKKLQEFLDTLIQDSRFNQHIHFIEWSDRFNCVVEDGIYISRTQFFMTKEEFSWFESGIKSYEKTMKFFKKDCN